MTTTPVRGKRRAVRLAVAMAAAQTAAIAGALAGVAVWSFSLYGPGGGLFGAMAYDSAVGDVMQYAAPAVGALTCAWAAICALFGWAVRSGRRHPALPDHRAGEAPA